MLIKPFFIQKVTFKLKIKLNHGVSDLWHHSTDWELSTHHIQSHSPSSSMASHHMFPKSKRQIRSSRVRQRSGSVVAEPRLIPMTSLTLSTEVTVCHFLTDFDVTHFQETLVLYPVNHMIVPYTRVYRHPLGQSCDRSTCHGAHTSTSMLARSLIHSLTLSVYVCVCVC